MELIIFKKNVAPLTRDDPRVKEKDVESARNSGESGQEEIEADHVCVEWLSKARYTKKQQKNCTQQIEGLEFAT
jgi:hypothetical protein